MIPIRYAFLLPVTIALLAACSDLRETVREKYTGERYGAPVEGNRRSPVLNPGHARPAPPRAPAVPASPPVSGKPSTPYDQFDADGNDTTRKNYVKEWLGDASKDDGMVRKPFRGEQAAPVTLMPKKETQPVSANEVMAAPLPAKPVDNQVVVDTVPEMPSRSDPLVLEENGVFLPDDPKPRSEMTLPEGAQFSQLQPASGGDVPTYPHLSSVPKTPPQFQELKKDKGIAEQEMQTQHDTAMEEKKKLDEEPTEMPSPTLPQVEGMIRDIKRVVDGDAPITIVAAGQ